MSILRYHKFELIGSAVELYLSETSGKITNEEEIEGTARLLTSD